MTPSPTSSSRCIAGDPAANLAVRTAGWHLGEVLAVVVNFFNPQVLVLGDSLAAADPLVASLRAAIYELCLPMAAPPHRTRRRPFFCAPPGH